MPRSTGSNKFAHSKLEDVKKVINDLNSALAREEWESIDKLIDKRNHMLSAFITTQLPEQYHQQAAELLTVAKGQDAEIRIQVNLNKDSIKQELIGQQRNNKSMQAYTSQK